MLKIRDLGINVVPATMRPPEIGPGGGAGLRFILGAREYMESCCKDSCVDTSCSVKPIKPASKTSKKPAKKPTKKSGYKSAAFGGEAVALLRRQLEEEIRNEH